MPACCSSTLGLVFFSFFNGFYGGFPRSTLGLFQGNKQTCCRISCTLVFHIVHLCIAPGMACAQSDIYRLVDEKHLKAARKQALAVLCAAPDTKNPA